MSAPSGNQKVSGAPTSGEGIESSQNLFAGGENKYISQLEIQEVLEVEPESNPNTRFWIFLMFCFLGVQNNFDTGVIPATLIQIEKELNLTFKQQATLGSLEYLGLSIATFIVPVALGKYQINKILAISTFMNGILSLMISLTSFIPLIYFGRFGQGFCAAFGCIYAPIWINHFSPSDKSTTWMGVLQSCGPLGVMIGYSTVALIFTLTGYEKCWRIGFAVLCLFTTITSVFFAFTDNSIIDILHEEKALKNNPNRNQFAHFQKNDVVQSRRSRNSQIESETGNDSISLVSHSSSYAQGCLDMFKQFGPILKHHIFIYVCLGICVLFYIVTGIQYWATEYFVKFAGASTSQAMAAFSFLAISGPIAGAIIGGKISDSLGGYKGSNRITALKFNVAVSLAALIFSIPVGYVVEKLELFILIWFLLCFGGALIPSGTGICLSCLPKSYHSTCSSLSQLIYNVGGYFLCPIVSGSIMDQFDDKLKGLIWGWRSVVIMGVIAPILFSKALYNEAHSPVEDYDQIPIAPSPKKKNIDHLPQSEKRTKAWSVL